MTLSLFYGEYVREDIELHHFEIAIGQECAGSKEIFKQNCQKKDRSEEMIDIVCTDAPRVDAT